MKEENPLFFERQFHGNSRYWNLRRFILALFCFIAYWITEKSTEGDIFLVVGSAILVISICITFVVHFKTSVYENCIVLDGIWSTRKVKIDFASIVKAEKTPYSTYLFNNPVYNLHKKGSIRFYTRGKEAVTLTDREGLKYIIGTQRPDELARIISNQLQKQS